MLQLKRHTLHTYNDNNFTLTEMWSRQHHGPSQQKSFPRLKSSNWEETTDNQNLIKLHQNIDSQRHQLPTKTT